MRLIKLLPLITALIMGLSTQGQKAITSGGGGMSGTGSATHSFGQVAYTTLYSSSDQSSAIQGVQLPFESFLPTCCGLENTDGASYNDGWQTGDGNNASFGTWTLSNSGSAGHFLSNSTSNGDGDSNSDGDIDVGGESWGLFANSGGTSAAVLPFIDPMVTESSLTLDMDNGWIDSGGPTVGFGIQNASGENLIEFFYRGGQPSYEVSANGGLTATGQGFSDEGLTISMTMLTSTTVEVQVTRLEGGTYTATHTLLNPAGGQVPTQLRVFNFNAGFDGQRNAYFNSVELCHPCPDVTPPSIETVSISSDNADPTLAKAGDIISLSFTTDETPAVTPTATIQSNTASVTGSGTSWTASWTVVGGDTNGAVSFSITVEDAAANQATATATTDASFVVIDTTAPAIAGVSIASNNVDPSIAEPGDVISLTFTTSETPSGTPVVTFNGNVATSVSGSGASWSATYNVTGSDASGLVSFLITVQDAAGNPGSSSTTNDASSVTIVLCDPPTVSSTVTDESCAGSADGTITVNTTGGSGTFTYSLNGGTPQASNVFTGLAASSYTVTVVVDEDPGCNATDSPTVGTIPDVTPPEFTGGCATEVADGASYNDGWQTGDGDASLLGTWSLSTTNGNPSNAGHFIGSSTSNGDGDANTDGDIDVGGESFGLYGNSSQTASAVLPFDAVMLPGDSLSLDMDNGFVDALAVVGIGIQNASGENLWEFFFRGGTGSYEVNQGGGAIFTGLGFTDEGLNIKLKMLTASTLEYTVTRLIDNVTVSGTSTTITQGGGQAPAQLRLFNFNAGGASSNDAYFNSIELCHACAEAITVNNDSGLCGAEVILSTPTVTDNCDEAGFYLQFNGGFIITNSPVGLPSGNGPRTFELRLRTTDNNGFSLVDLGGSGLPNRQRLRGTVSGQVEFIAGTGLVLTSTMAVNDGNWHHIALTTDGAIARLYVDGVLDVSVSATSLNTPASVQFRVGRDIPWGEGGTATGYTGDMDEVRIWNIARSAADIANNQNTTLTASPGLVLGYNFDEGSGTVANDYSGNGNNNNIAQAFFPQWSDPGIILSNNAPTVFNVGETTVTWTATDAAGNSSTCTQSITVNDTGAPTITCPAALMVDTDPGVCTASNVDLGAPVVSDNCSVTGNALSFDGVDDYVVTLPINIENTGITVEAWINPTTFSLYDRIAEQDYASAWYFGSSIGSNDLSVFLNNTEVLTTSGSQITPGSWQHVAFVYDLSTVTIYINGVAAASAATTGSVSSNLPLYIGEIPGNTFPDRDFEGSMDEVRIWNTARTQAEIQANMNTELIAQAGLVAAFHFNEGVAAGTNAGVTTATDASGNGNDGTLNNFALNGSTSNWVAGNAFATPTVTNDAPATYAVGITTVTWTATDAAGNSSTCTQTVTVVDNEAPTATCNGTLSINLDGTGNYTLTAGEANNGSTDNCSSGAGLTLSLDRTTFSCADVDLSPITVTLSVTDEAGNSSTCTSQVTVNANGNCPPDNDDCSTAISLTPSLWGTPAWETHSVSGATESSTGCIGDADDDTWYSFVAESANDVIIVNDIGSASDMVVEVYDGCGGSSLGCFDNYGLGEFERCHVGGLTVGSTYYFRTYDKATGGPASGEIRLLVKTFAIGAIRDIFCGITDYGLEDYFTPERQDFNQLYPFTTIATAGYGVRMTDQGTTTAYEKNKIGGYGTQFFQFSDFLPGIPFNTLFDAQARHALNLNVNGAVTLLWSDYGPACTMGLGGVTQTQIRPEYCTGAVDYSFSDQIQATPVPDATQYRFIFTENGNTFTRTKSSYSLNLNDVPGLEYGKTYQVTVRVQVNGTWSLPGASCSINMLTQPPATSVTQQYCNGTVLYPSSNYILAEIVQGADLYQWRFIPLGGGQATYEYTTSYSLSFGPLTEVNPGVTYDVAVRARVQGLWGDFQDECPLTIQPNPGMEAPTDLTEAKWLETGELTLYPNPSGGEELMLILTGLDEEEGTVQLELLDMMGRLIQSERISVKGEQINYKMLFEERLPSGLYLIRASQEGMMMTRRLVIE